MPRINVDKMTKEDLKKRVKKTQTIRSKINKKSYIKNKDKLHDKYVLNKTKIMCNHCNKSILKTSLLNHNKSTLHKKNLLNVIDPTITETESLNKI